MKQITLYLTAMPAFLMVLSVGGCDVGHSHIDNQDHAANNCDYGEPHPAALPEISEFSFLIGDYSVTMHKWLGEDWSPAQPGVTARWNGRYALDGMAIADEWFLPDPGTDPNAPRGINVRMFDKEAGEWDMMWLHSVGRQTTDLRAKMIDGALTMWQVTPERPDFKATFHVEDSDHWSRVAYVPTADGGWQKNFLLKATRIPCSAS